MKRSGKEVHHVWLDNQPNLSYDFSILMKDTPPDDADLIARIAQAQTKAFDRLYERYNRLVFSVAIAILGDQSAAEEATLDVFVQVWKKASTYRADHGQVRTWLTAITRHHAIDILRWRKARPDAEGVSWDETTLQDRLVTRDTEEVAELTFQRERVQEALAQLPEDQREALKLAYFNGYSHSQIADVLKQPLGTIKTRIRLGMQKLRQLLEQGPVDG